MITNKIGLVPENNRRNTIQLYKINQYKCNIKNNNKNPQWVQKKTAAIFFDIKKAYNKISRNKTFEQLEIMKIQE